MKGITFEEKQNIILAQARRIESFKQTDEYALLLNTFLILKKTASDEAMKAMRMQATRERSIYFQGYEHGMQMCIDGIDKIVADGDAVRSAREKVAQYQED